MRVVRFVASFVLAGAVAGCSISGQGTATAPAMPNVVGKKLDVALNDIKSAGFKDKDKVEVIGGGTFGMIEKSNWTVCTQVPAAGQPIPAAPKLTVERSCESETAGSSAAPTTTPASTTTTASTTTAVAPSGPSSTTTQPPEQNLTVANSPELAALLTGRNDCDEVVEAFATANAGKTIEFDGTIGHMTNWGDSQPGYDFLLFGGNAGDKYDGPSFKFRNVSIPNLHLTDPSTSAQIRQDANIHIVAKVETFNSVQCLFYLEPVSTTVR